VNIGSPDLSSDLLVVFYVNKLAQQQNDINDQMRQIITQLIAELNEPDTPPDS
jgi:hypothetical protein